MPLPLLSSTPPPFVQADSCRACGKKVASHRLFNSSKAKNCNHCGHVFCGDHCAHSAVRLRTASDPGIPGGMIEVPCCSFCIGFLQVTSSTQEQLHCLSTKELKRYLNAYSIPIPLGVNEKSQLEQVIIRSRVDGVLPPWHEAFYRNNSIPPAAPASTSSGSAGTGFFNNIFSSLDETFSSDPPRPQSTPAPAPPRRDPSASQARPSPSQARPLPQQTRPNTAHARPPPTQDRPQPNPPTRPQQSTSNPRPPPSSASNGRPSPATRSRPSPPSQPQPIRPQPSQPTSASTTWSARPPSASPPLPRTSSYTPPSTSSTPPTTSSPSIFRLPTLLELYETPESLPDLSIKTLKSILHRSHVRSDNLLEKSELVARVEGLVEDEGRRAQREEEEEEERLEEERVGREEEARERGVREREERERAERVRADGLLASRMEELNTSTNDDRATKEQEEKAGAAAASTLARERRRAAETVERTGLCIICQDSDAILASVDCGHLALCNDCSELVMAGNRQCPLCRTIMRPGGLIRIFKT